MLLKHNFKKNGTKKELIHNEKKSLNRHTIRRFLSPNKIQKLKDVNVKILHFYILFGQVLTSDIWKSLKSFSLSLFNWCVKILLIITSLLQHLWYEYIKAIIFGSIVPQQINHWYWYMKWHIQEAVAKQKCTVWTQHPILFKILFWSNHNTV